MEETNEGACIAIVGALSASWSGKLTSPAGLSAAASTSVSRLPAIGRSGRAEQVPGPADQLPVQDC